MNILLLLCELILVFGFFAIFSVSYKKEGLFAFAAIMSVLGNIFVAKQVDFLIFPTSLSAVEFVSLFLADNLLTECYGKETAKKSVWIQALSSIVYLSLSLVVKNYQPNSMDTISPHLSVIFSGAPRICVMSILAMVISGYVDIFIFNISGLFLNKYFVVRNILSSILATIFDNILFSFLAFYRNPIVNMSIRNIFGVAIVASFIKGILILILSPFTKFVKSRIFLK